MIATANYLVAQERINDLTREAERNRRAAAARSPRRASLSIPRVFARRTAKTAAA
jgi:hypothetical protein